MPVLAKDARARFAPLVAGVAREWRRAVDARLPVYGLTEATWLPLLATVRDRLVSLAEARSGTPDRKRPAAR